MRLSIRRKLNQSYYSIIEDYTTISGKRTTRTVEILWNQSKVEERFGKENTILKIKEYEDSLFLRVDFVKQEDKFLVMEVELLDPNLFLEFVSDRKRKKEILDFFAKQIVRYTKK